MMLTPAFVVKQLAQRLAELREQDPGTIDGLVVEIYQPLGEDLRGKRIATDPSCAAAALVDALREGRLSES
jgi:hypothetical protein